MMMVVTSDRKTNDSWFLLRSVHNTCEMVGFLGRFGSLWHIIFKFQTFKEFTWKRSNFETSKMNSCRYYLKLSFIPKCQSFIDHSRKLVKRNNRIMFGENVSVKLLYRYFTDLIKVNTIIFNEIWLKLNMESTFLAWLVKPTING